MGSRAEMLQQLCSGDHRFNLIIIGGGITGCGVAHQAAAMGARVLLLEQGDFASGTSSRSTKLIHGGIRYLKQFDFRLVREGVHERQALIEAAPHLVHPVSFLYPIHKGGPDSLLALRLGLMLYDWFAGRKNLLRHRMLPQEELLAEEPLIERSGLQGGALYADCLTDDARLTVEMARAAEAQGAVLINYMAVEGFHYDQMGRVAGVTVADRLGGGATYVCEAPVVLNASGPWVDHVRRLDDVMAAPLLHLTKGVHMTVLRERLPFARPVVMHAADGRLMFAVPRGAYTYIGTTDTDFQGDPGEAQVEPDDVQYIMAAANRNFPAAKLSESDVHSSWAGVRSLAAPHGAAGPSQISRDYRLHTSPTGLVSVAGGKLTAFAAMARVITGKILPDRPRTVVPLRLGGAVAIPSEVEVGALADRFGVSGLAVQELIGRHGAGLRQIVPLMRGDGDERARMLSAEARWAVQQEFAVTLSDVMVRRTAQLLFGADAGWAAVPAVARAMAEELGWSEEELASQVAAYEAEVQAMFAWRGSGDRHPRGPDGDETRTPC